MTKSSSFRTGRNKSKSSLAPRVRTETREPLNRKLTAAREAKQDEFYTRFVDIQKEVEAYLESDPNTFRGKVVYCNCDDPFESNFFKYFAANFNKLGLKRLLTTSYDGSPIAGAQLKFGEYEAENGDRPKPKAVALSLEEVKSEDGASSAGIADVRRFLEKNPHTRSALSGGGDFRSPECEDLLKQADIVVTNPPFSLFSEYVAQLMRHKKKFLIIGNTNAITYKDVFPHIKADRMWLGCTNFNVGMFFEVPDSWSKFHHIDPETGKKIARVSTSCWYTNLDHGRRHKPLSLMTMVDNLKYSRGLKGKQTYDRYDNYDAIEVATYKEIPLDYDGVMGVPVTFLDKYCPEQFEIVGTLESSDPDNPYRTKWYSAQDQRDAYFRRFGKSGSIPLNMSGVINDRKVYKRILIRHRRPSRREGAKK
ncbi:adenine-specific methyltransferase EcoRI family protein [Luteimonas dalianensis]|uniref:adenine-specific methyltransferase EcoRI family protein n=1 Tax=Luteimonas dalianensis TaxID=1148196 RepID=UPI003BF45850